MIEQALIFNGHRKDGLVRATSYSLPANPLMSTIEASLLLGVEKGFALKKSRDDAIEARGRSMTFINCFNGRMIMAEMPISDIAMENMPPFHVSSQGQLT